MSIRNVALLHGIWMPSASMAWLASRLRRAGFEPRVCGYPGAMGGPHMAASWLLMRLRDADAVVAHSLGGLMVLELLRQYPELRIKRVVCIGSPLRGSEAARELRRRPWGALLLGRCSEFLPCGLPPWDGEAQVGMIAGMREQGVGRYFACFDGPSDGTVSVEETRLTGLTDHCLVDASHSGILFSGEAARQTIHFLKKGRFSRARRSPMN
ncbi:MAG: alpha/beta hydrolase [Xanthomonadaceae bacterium]|nr:alpha/beta hydrolase [Xanthomonadaceae bacterium]